MKGLPVGVSSLSEIIKGGYIYVDKSALLQKLSNGKYYFLSRPRRFGKSLLVDTFKEMFEGNRELFKGLSIYETWDWSITYPVIHLNLAEGKIHSRSDLDSFLRQTLHDNITRLGVDLPVGESDNPGIVFGQLVRRAYTKFDQQLVVLVDEYDKPILDNLLTDTAEEIRDGLQNLYSVIKAHDARLRFVFLTGISKFARVGVFSELNNLTDITLDARFGSICGYTQTELEHYFAEHLNGVDLQQVKEWYNGYNWLNDHVYNPFNILLFLEQGKEFRPYWSATSNPSFLINLLKSKYYYAPNIESVEASDTSLDNFDIHNIKIESLLFQAGYLTIQTKDTSFGEPIYTLGLPNKEVRAAFNKLILENYFASDSGVEGDIDRIPTLKALRAGDTDTIRTQLEILFSGIANDNYRNNKLATYEGFYASVVYAYFNSLGLETISEDVTNKGRIDLTIKVDDAAGLPQVYIIEFKVVDDQKRPGQALQQIKDKNYAQKYQNYTTTIIGIEFSETTRNITDYQTETTRPH